MSSINVTAPLWASARPSIETPAVIEIEVQARMVPANVEDEPSVAELPTCQKTLHAWAPLTRFIWLDAVVASVEPAWKMKTESGSF